MEREQVVKILTDEKKKAEKSYNYPLAEALSIVLEDYAKKNTKEAENIPVGTTLRDVYIDGENLYVVKNEATNQMSVGYSKKQAIEKYLAGNTFDAMEWERELEEYCL